MGLAGLTDFADYVDFLEVHPEEFAVALQHDPDQRHGLLPRPLGLGVPAAEVLPRLVGEQAARGRPDPGLERRLRSGEEAYSLAIALAEALGPDAFRDRVKIYATDVDDAALARPGWPPTTPRNSRAIPPSPGEVFRAGRPPLHGFQKDFRRSVIFGRHDLIQDAPISRIDLLICRNTLMYFNTETQARSSIASTSPRPTGGSCSWARPRPC